MHELPSGTVTFLFTDIEGSTRLLHELGERYADVLADHRRTLRGVFDRHGGVEVDTQGDAFFVAFERAKDAVAAAAEAQRALAVGRVRVRMGIHTGEPIVTDEGYVGIDVHRAARVMGVAHGGQVVVSEQTQRMLDGELELRDLGLHRLKDLQQPERLFQVGEDDFPALRSLHATNLPIQPTPLIGRERELDELLSLLRRDAVRLVTLTGPGGTGKTRLALQVAAELIDEFESGAFWVSLAALDDPKLLIPTIAQTLGVRESPQEALADTLAAYIGDKRMLLLLDNFEQIVSAAPRLRALLSQCPELHLLVTSRAVLRINGERDYYVDPLPDRDATQLFIERGRQVKPSFEPDEHVVMICQRLDGLPLAIELAAARVRVLEPETILDRLEHRLPLLTTGGRDAPARQLTLRAAIEWSYDLLDDEEKQLFRRLAVFAGSFTVDAAEDVCAAELDTLTALVEKSLLRATGADRLFMLETIREYALERLEESGDARETRRAHAAHFCRLAREAEGPLRSGAQLKWLDRLEAEHDNLRAALQWALDEGEALAAVELAADLGPFWSKRGYVADARHSLDLALDASREISTPSRAAALRFAGRFALDQDDPEIGVPRLEESAELCRELDDLAGLSNTLGHLAWWAGLVEGDAARARSLAEESLALARHVGDQQLIAHALNALGGAALDQGELAEAKDLFEEALVLHRELGDPAAVAQMLVNLGWLELAAGDYDAAVAPLEEAFALAEELRDKPLCASAAAFLGFALLHLAEREGVPELFVQSLILNTELQHPRLIVECLHGLAGAAAAEGDETRAVRLAGAAERLLEELHLPLVPVEVATLDRFVAPMQAEMGEEAFAEAWVKGRGMSQEEAVELALAGAVDIGRADATA